MPNLLKTSDFTETATERDCIAIRLFAIFGRCLVQIAAGVYYEVRRAFLLKILGSASSRPRPLSSKSVPIYYWLIVLSADSAVLV